MKIVTVEQMLELERRSAESGFPPEELMENAGLAIAEESRILLPGIMGRSIVVLVGPGNNGGDGLVAARHLSDWGARIHLFIVKRRTQNDRNFTLALERSIEWIDVCSEEDICALNSVLSSADMVIDAVFGTGKTRPIEGIIRQMLEAVKQARCHRTSLKVLAVDLPSGMNADTGEIDPSCLTADLTLTLGFPKIGLFRFPGAGKLGRLGIADIGIPVHLAENIHTELITGDTVRSLLPPRPLDANKGTFGRLLVVAGSVNYVGAAYLACQGAMRVGTGLVTLATPKGIQRMVAGRLTEATYLPLPETEPGIIDVESIAVIQEQLGNYDALLIGCGLGQHSKTAAFVRELLFSSSSAIPTVIDADGLNSLTAIPNWWERLKPHTVLTPHPGEMARLLGSTVPQVQEDRLKTARSAAAVFGQTVVLKGAHTVVASPDSSARISGEANPGLASAGTGDVLAGTIAGLLAQGLHPFGAATCGVYLHAMAAQSVRAELGDTGMIASDLLPRLPLIIKQLKEASPKAQK